MDYEGTFICSLNLKSKEEGKHPSCSFELILHQINKFFARILISITKDNVINIKVNDEQVFSFLLIRSVILTLPILKPLSTRNFFNLSYQALEHVSDRIMSYLIHRHGLKTLRLFNIHFLHNISIYRNTFYIHLKKFNVHMTCKTKKYPNGLKTS